MTSTQALSLQLIPMQLPETAENHRRKSLGNGALAPALPSQERPHKTLLIRPGEPSEFVVKLRHLGDRPMQVELQVEGDFPLDWCQIGGEGSELLPGQSMEIVLYFQIPSDWFESDQQQAQCQIDRVGRLCVHWYEPETGRRQLEWSDFRLNIRPRSLYLNFLPTIYQEVDFVGRFLKIFEESFEPSVQTLDLLWAYLDPLTAPEGLLPLLSHWVGWQPAGYMNLDRQRRCMQHAIEIYRWRGTKHGLRLYLHLATGLPLDPDQPEAEKHISIQEFLGGGLILGHAQLAQNALIGGGKAFHFRVCLTVPQSTNAGAAPLSIDEQLIRQIIDQEKPAFCSYELQINSA